MEKRLKKIWPYVGLYIIAVPLGILLLFLVSKIPQSAIREHWKEGRDTNISHYGLRLINKENLGTCIDDYTDNLKMDLAYRLNENSVLAPTAYFEDLDMEYDYGRYWQGYCILLRPLMLFLNLNQIRFLCRCLLAMCFLLFLYVLIKNKKYALTIGIGAAFYISNFWVTFYSLQYFNCTMIALLASVLIMQKSIFFVKNKYLFFMAIGIMVAYFDFLTFESLTISLPLLCAEISNEEEESFFQKIRHVAKSVLAWLSGYAFMFATKWILWISIKGKEAAEMIRFKLMERTTGKGTMEVYSVKDAVMLNLSNLKGITLDNWMSISLIIGVLIMIYIYLFHGIKKYNGGFACLMIGCLPIIRFIIIREHSATHFYYTYFALFSTVAADIYVLLSVFTEIVIYLRKKKEKSK